eukprot:1767820-Prymnesium_polylepis.2
MQPARAHRERPPAHNLGRDTLSPRDAAEKRTQSAVPKDTQHKATPHEITQHPFLPPECTPSSSS